MLRQSVPVLLCIGLLHLAACGCALSCPPNFRSELLNSIKLSKAALLTNPYVFNPQVYGGAVYMDFDKSRFKRRGHGRYEPLPPALLPPLWLIYCDNPSDSGRVHSDVKRRWLEGDPEVREKMALVAACAEEGRCVV